MKTFNALLIYKEDYEAVQLCRSKDHHHMLSAFLWDNMALLDIYKDVVSQTSESENNTTEVSFCKSHLQVLKGILEKSEVQSRLYYTVGLPTESGLQFSQNEWTKDWWQRCTY